MLSRTLRPLTARATSTAIPPLRSNTFLGPFGIRMVTNATETPADSTTTNASASETTASPQTPNTTKPQLPYFVARNSLGNLSVYQTTIKNGTAKKTTLKRTEGDVIALKNDIKAALQLPDKGISVNGLTKHIVIKDAKRTEVLNFLTTIGF
ncbi:mitochondrial large subunit ribosomal protein-domain-containing protein [Xylaria nigripes]|nr:mitochondrial large subunit ribosomal protein-domain-containing protein [Xylaria nigripes]